MANIPLYYDRATWLFLLDEVVAEAEEKADEAEDMVATCLFSRSELAGHAP